MGACLSMRTFHNPLQHEFETFIKHFLLSAMLQLIVLLDKAKVSSIMTRAHDHEVLVIGSKNRKYFGLRFIELLYHLSELLQNALFVMEKRYADQIW